jgi:hypothetical protein
MAITAARAAEKPCPSLERKVHRDNEHGGTYFTHSDLEAMVAAAVAFKDAQITELLAKLDHYRKRSIVRSETGAFCMICKGSWSHTRGSELHEKWCPSSESTDA